MNYGMYMSAAGAHALSRKVDVISHNLANVDTAAFKRELAILESRDAEAVERGLVVSGQGQLEDLGGGVDLTHTITDFQTAVFKDTGSPSDVALESPDVFFHVQRGEQQYFTRDGAFQRTPEGRLVTNSGDAVLSADGEPIQLNPLGEWSVTNDGKVQHAGDVIDLAIIQPADKSDLEKTGDNLFRSKSGATPPASPENRRVRGGWREASGVNPIQEMTELISAQRFYETNIRMVQHHDQATGSLLSRMLRA
jgi:flagellar basal-body rod protein FlgF